MTNQGPTLPAPQSSGQIDASDVAAFAVASGDHNPIHLSAAAAQRVGLAEPVVHGMYVAARFEVFLEQIAGYRLVELKIRFVRPIPVGSSLQISARHLPADGPQTRLRLVATTDGIGIVCVGEAMLSLSCPA